MKSSKNILIIITILSSIVTCSISIKFNNEEIDLIEFIKGKILKMPKLEPIKSKAIMVLGLTGTGKSTLVNYLNGIDLKCVYDQEKARWILDLQSENKTLPGGFRIGHKQSSETFYPAGYSPNEQDFTYIDNPGFKDTRDFEYEISNGFLREKITQNVTGLKFLLLLIHDDLKIRGQQFRSSIKSFSNFLGIFDENVENLSKSIGIVVTRVENNNESDLQMKKALKKILKLTLDDEKRSSKLSANEEMVFKEIIENDQIEIFSNPKKQGPLSKNQSFQILSLIDRLKYAEKDKLKLRVRVDIEYETKLLHFTNTKFEQFKKDFKISIDNVVTKYYEKEKIDYINYSQVYLNLKSIKNKINNQSDFESFINNFDEVLLNRIEKTNILSKKDIFNFFFQILTKESTNYFQDIIDWKDLKIKLDGYLTNIIKKFRIQCKKFQTDLKPLLLENLSKYFLSSLNKTLYKNHIKMMQNQLLYIKTNIEQNKFNFNLFINDINELILNKEFKEKILRNKKMLDQFNTIVPKVNEFNFDLENIIESMINKINDLNNELSKYYEEISIYNQKDGFYFYGHFVTISQVLKKIKQDINIKNLKYVKIFSTHSVDFDTNYSINEERYSNHSPDLIIISPKILITEDLVVDLSCNKMPGYPDDEEKAKNGIEYGNKGEDGKPGLPGFNGGNLYIVTNHIDDLNKLQFISNGGPGGFGQKGGDGKEGRKGLNAILEEVQHAGVFCQNLNLEKCNITESCYYEANIIKEQIVSHRSVHFFIKCGNPGQKGGDSGSGGLGGICGNSGINVYNIRGSRLVPIQYPNECKKGVDGEPGLPGEGGSYGNTFRRGKYVRENLIRSKTEEWIEINDTTIPNSLRSQNGSKSNKLNSKNIKSALIVAQSYEASLVYQSLTEHFKYYFQEAIELKNSRLDNGLFNNFMGDFNLNLNPSLFEIIDRVKIFNRTEQAHLLPSVKNEIINKRVENNDEKLLKFYIELLISSLERRFNTEKEKIFVIDLEDYIEITLDQIKVWKSWSHQEILNGLKLKYESNLDDKIKETNQLINELQQNIENNEKKINNNINDILTELMPLKEQVKNEASKLANKKNELEKNLAIKSIFTILKVACQALSFLGPKGALIGSIAEVGVDMIAQLSELNVAENTITINSDILKIDNMMQKNLRNLNKIQMKKIEKQIDILDIKNKIENKLDLKLEPKKDHLSKIQKLPNSEAKSKLEATYNYLLTRNSTEKKKHENKLKELKFNKKSSTLNKIDAGLQVAKLVTDFIDEKQLTSKEIQLIEEEINKNSLRYEYLNEIENKINDLQTSVFIEMNKELSMFTKNLQLNLSNARLDFNKFKIKETLQELKNEIFKFINELEGKKELEYTINQIENAILTMVDIYSHIEKYFQQKEFSTYMSAIVQIQHNVIDVPQNEYQEQIKSLKKSIQENVIIKMYQQVEEAFKYWSFPFFNYQYFQANSIIEISNYENKLKEIQEIIKGDKITLKPSKDNRLIYTNFNKENPFFEWNSENNSFTIENLLNGENTIFYADINNTKLTENAHAIKFNKCSIEIEILNQTEYVNELLQNFNIVLTHSGTSFYKYYEMNIEYNFGEKIQLINKYGNYETLNESGKKLASKRPFLSPYTFWNIKLETKESTRINRLKQLIKEKNYTLIKVFLIGHGSYIDS